MRTLPSCRAGAGFGRRIHLFHGVAPPAEGNGAGKIGQPNTGVSRGHDDRVALDQAEEGTPALVIALVAPGTRDSAAEKESPILSVERNKTGSLGAEAGRFFASGIVE